MKKFNLPMIIMIIVTFGFTLKSNAQKQISGLYLTYNDYSNHKLSYSTDAANNNKIFFHEFLGQNNVTVISNGKKLVMPKNEIFGYRNNNHDYRFYNNVAYQVVDTAGFYIYSYEKLLPQATGKGPKPTTVYFFSKKTGDEILPLTPENIARAFPKNTKFKFMVETAANSEIKLDAYDNDANEYKIKELYTESLK